MLPFDRLREQSSMTFRFFEPLARVSNFKNQHI